MQMHNNYATSILSPKLSITIIEAKEVVSHEWPCMDAGLVNKVFLVTCTFMAVVCTLYVFNLVS